MMGDRQGHILLQGRCLTLEMSSKGRPKYLRLGTEEGEQRIKLPKYVGYTLRREIQPGVGVQIWAQPKEDGFKAVLVVPLDPQAEMSLPKWTPPMAPVYKVEVCRKGSCMKRGSLQVLHALEQAVQEHPEGSKVVVTGTGCLKACKQGPNLRFSPGSKEYHGVRREQAAAIVQQFLAKAKA